MKFGCSATVVAARAALSKSTLVKSLRLQPLPAKMLTIALMGMAADLLGSKAEYYSLRVAIGNKVSETSTGSVYNKISDGSGFAT
ncbi:unnamed protein product [Eruca vesicaria subsp. sativa]|uniref:Uncharacterized protein n=1 Tax=Eruca vesicaria subsp. sativa TaxID=29727 RepID=A0ABC8M1W8_ERUVS|nr:unnamed protein product [Eruca vesicaria subsp. sativa]